MEGDRCRKSDKKKRLNERNKKSERGGGYKNLLIKVHVSKIVKCSGIVRSLHVSWDEQSRPESK